MKNSVPHSVLQVIRTDVTMTAALKGKTTGLLISLTDFLEKVIREQPRPRLDLGDLVLSGVLIALLLRCCSSSFYFYRILSSNHNTSASASSADLLWFLDLGTTDR